MERPDKAKQNALEAASLKATEKALPPSLSQAAKLVEVFNFPESENEYDYKVLKSDALNEMVTILTNENYAGTPSLAEKATLLRTLILEKAAVIEGTSVPATNKNRFLVEALSEKLALVEKFEDGEFKNPELKRGG